MDFNKIDKITFQTEKEKLRNYAIEQLNKPGQTKLNTESLTKLIRYLNDYTYENRLEMKGVITYTIIDSLEFDDETIPERFIAFDGPLRDK